MPVFIGFYLLFGNFYAIIIVRGKLSSGMFVYPIVYPKPFKEVKIMAKRKIEKLKGIEEIVKDGKVIRYKIRCCVGRDDHRKQVWKTTTVSADDPRIEGLTPGKLADELNNIKHQFSKEQKSLFENGGHQVDKQKDKQTITFYRFASEKWLDVHVNKGTAKPTTKAFYGYMADDILSYFGERVKLNDIDREEIEKYENYLRNEAKTKAGKSLSDTSVRRHLETLRNILNYARVNRYISNDPFADYPIKNKSEEAEKVDFLRPEEIISFYDHLENESTFWQLYVRMSLLCGLRRGEMVALQWGDIETERRRITVKRNVTVDVKKKETDDAAPENGYHIGSTKSKKERTVYYTQTVADLLTKFESEQKAKFGYGERDLPKDAFVFCASNDLKAPIYPTTPTTWLKRFEQRNGLREVSPHDLRHTTGTLAKMAGYGSKDIQTELGHSDSKTTDKFYVGIDEQSLQNIPADIENVIERAKGVVK